MNTRQIATSGLFENLVLTGLLAFISYWTLPGLIEQYSFWRDEIFTAAFISGSWLELFRDWIGPDVHPPLYFVITKTWSFFLGTSEISLRGFSFIFSIATIVLLWNDWRTNKRTQRLIALLFITSSPTFLYYSQEARSYTLVLFLCCLLLLRIFKHRNEDATNREKAKLNPLPTYGICIALSLTHYFGLLLAFFVLVIDCWDLSISRHRFASAMVIGLICLWPVFHIGFLGDLGGVQQEKLSNLTGSFSPITSTLGAYIYSSLYFVNSGIKWLNVLMVGIAGSALSYSILANKELGNENPRKTRSDLKYSITLIGITLLFLIVFEIYWPITTARNLIILLYPTSIIIGSIFEYPVSKLKSKGITKILIGVFSATGLSMIILLSAKIGTNNIHLKENHGIDYKSLATYLSNNRTCLNGCLTLDYDPNGKGFGATIDDYYFGDLNLSSYSRAIELDPSEVKLMPIIGSYKNEAEIKEFANQFKNRKLITSCSRNLRKDQRTPFILTSEAQHTEDKNLACISK